MKSYGELLRVQGVARILLAQLLARFPGGMLSLGTLIHIERIFDSYGAAGLVLAALSVGQAIAGPLTSRWMGRWGMRPVLILTTIVCAFAIATIALVPLPLHGYMAVAAIAGLAFPPIQPAVRTIYPKMVNSRQMTPLFSLDATAQEFIWIVGPVIVTVVATQVSTVLGILMSVVFLVGGGAWFIASPELGRVRIPPSKRRFGSVLGRPPVVLATIVGALVVGSFAATEAGVVAWFGEEGPEAGLVLAIWSIASFAGGLAFGHLPIGPWALARRVSVIAVGTLLAAFAWDFWSLSGLLVLAGLFIAPTLAVLSTLVSVSVRFSDTAEAYGWVGTGQLLGVAMGSAVAGFVIDATVPAGGLVTGAISALLAAVMAAVFVRALPDLRGRDVSPIPDTEPVPTQPS